MNPIGNASLVVEVNEPKARGAGQGHGGHQEVELKSNSGIYWRFYPITRIADATSIDWRTQPFEKHGPDNQMDYTCDWQPRVCVSFLRLLFAIGARAACCVALRFPSFFPSVRKCQLSFFPFRPFFLSFPLFTMRCISDRARLVVWKPFSTCLLLVLKSIDISTNSFYITFFP